MEATCRDGRRAAAETNKPCFSAARRFELFYALRGVSQPPGLPVLISAAQFVFSLSLPPGVERALSLCVVLLFFFHITLIWILNNAKEGETAGEEKGTEAGD